jgi:hypothetical protein
MGGHHGGSQGISAYPQVENRSDTTYEMNTVKIQRPSSNEQKIKTPTALRLANQEYLEPKKVPAVHTFMHLDWCCYYSSNDPKQKERTTDGHFFVVQVIMEQSAVVVGAAAAAAA